MSTSQCKVCLATGHFATCPYCGWNGRVVYDEPYYQAPVPRIEKPKQKDEETNANE